MELGTGIDEGRCDGASTRMLLDELSSEVRLRRDSEVREWQAIVAWADTHTVDSPDGAVTLTERGLDTGVPIAGPGAPLVSEFGLMELIAVLERSPDGGRSYVGKVVERAWRLPGLYTAVLTGRCRSYRALEVADHTRMLSPQAAAHVDRHLAPVAGTCSWAQIERLITEAITRFDPDTAEERRRAAADQRRFDIDHDTTTGLAHVDGLLDTADAIDLDTAVGRRATLLGRLGAEDTLDVRRSIAAGELARADLHLDLLVEQPATGETVTIPGRKVELHVHLTDTAIAAVASEHELDEATCVGRLDQTRSPVATTQIRDWLTRPGTTVIVRPVIDITGHAPVDSYEIPERHRRHVELRDHTCRFPWCARPAQACDLDHAEPHADGGPTCPCNEVPLCRRHHRAKTHRALLYTVIEPGTYLWTSRHHHRWLVDPTGTRPLDHHDHDRPTVQPPDE